MKVQFNTEQTITRRYEFDTDTDLFNPSAMDYNEISKQCHAAICDGNMIDERGGPEMIVPNSVTRPNPKPNRH